MDAAIITNWRRVVLPVDVVYVLGDVSFYSGKKTCDLLDQLPGLKILVNGNHDKGMQAYVRAKFLMVKDLMEINLKTYEPNTGPDPESYEQRIVLCHYPLVTWNASHYGSWMLHGHCHGNLKSELLPKALRIDVGVDAQHFTPVSFEQLQGQMTLIGKTMQVDHHGTSMDYDEGPDAP